MNTYLLEIGVEELPAKQITRVVANFKKHIASELDNEKVVYHSLQVWSTPRRIAVSIDGIADKLPDENLTVSGPSLEIAYQNGQPTPALLGFLNRNGATAEDIVVAAKGKNQIVTLHVTATGAESKSILSRLASGWITAATFDKSMRWRDYHVQFARPIRWLVSLFNGEHLPVSIEGLSSDTYTYGHRTLANRKIQIPEAQAYLDVMREAKIIVDPQTRKESILAQIEKLEQAYCVTAERDDALMDEIINLVEYPTVFAGHLDRAFLSLPAPVITTPMKDHQRYFPTRTMSGDLSDVFFAVRNGDDFCLEVVAKGNERVLRARLRDAQFFFTEDTKRPFEHFVESLKTVIYQVQLGTIFDKVERIDTLSAFIAGLVHLPSDRMPLLHRAVLLCKADLNTAMVNEFDELQGVMGKIYAKSSHEDDDVCAAIESHYLPRFFGDDIPSDIFGKIMSVADKTDSLVGSYGIGVVPKSTKDPFGLRRTMISILSVVLSDPSAFNPDLEAVIGKSAELLAPKMTQNKDQVVEQVREAMMQRLRVIMNDKGYRHDIVEAGLRYALRDIASFIARCHALSSYDREKLEQTTTNLLRAIKLSSNAKDGLSVNMQLFESDSESVFFEKIKTISARIYPFIERHDYVSALDALDTLGHAIASFLEDVMVMHEKDEIRENRMQLLRLCSDMALAIADFNKIQFH